MLINKKQVRALVKDKGKRCSRSFLERLDGKIKNIIINTIENARAFKTLTDKDLI